MLSIEFIGSLTEAEAFYGHLVMVVSLFDFIGCLMMALILLQAQQGLCGKTKESGNSIESLKSKNTKQLSTPLKEKNPSRNMNLKSKTGIQWLERFEAHTKSGNISMQEFCSHTSTDYSSFRSAKYQLLRSFTSIHSDTADEPLYKRWGRVFDWYRNNPFKRPSLYYTSNFNEDKNTSKQPNDTRPSLLKVPLPVSQTETQKKSSSPSATNGYIDVVADFLKEQQSVPTADPVQELIFDTTFFTEK